MKTMFRVNSYNLNEIEELEASRTTDKTIWFKYKNWKDELVEDRGLRVSSNSRWFDNELDARTYVISRFNNKIASLRNQIEYLEIKQSDIKLIAVIKDKVK